MAAAAYDSDDSGAGPGPGHGGHSSSDESVDIDFHGIRRTVFQGNMAQVEREIEELGKGTLKEYVEEVARADQERLERIRQAELYRTYRLEAINQGLQEDIDEIRKQLEREKEDVREQMLEDLRERKRRLEDERNNNDLVEETRAQGWRKSVRGKKGEEKKEKQPDRITKRKKVQPPTGPKISIKLKDGDIAEDVLLVGTRAARGEKGRAGGRR